MPPLGDLSFLVVDNFCPLVDDVRTSALQSGFGTWKPSKGKVGSSNYEGMNFWGRHSVMLHSLKSALGQPFYPNCLFFRVTNKDTERAYVHSDRETGSWTCLAYLSDHHKTVSGTAFFRHKRTGLTCMPTFAEMEVMGKDGKQLMRDMVHGTAREWEQLDFVRGQFNRALFFKAPLFHARRPQHGIGTTPEDGRMIWGTHGEVENPYCNHD